MKKINQKGFSAVEGLLILVIVSVIGFIGWYVWNSNKKTTTSYNNAAATNQAASTTKKSTSAASETAAKPTTKYFEVKEWGVKAPYDGTLTLRYAIGTKPYPTNNAYFTSTQLTAVSDPYCGIGRSGASDTQNAGGGYIGRYLPTDKIPAEGGEVTAQAFLSQDFKAGNSTPPSYSKVGNYYYIYWSGQSDCSSSALVKQTKDAVGALTSSFVAL
ncbi:MAG: hypothetical protein JWS12_239 [Candidatus Saccharibacteria bacterium]|nr:hypothetical protein [Candidatus Saccharibacteria bacterium]